MSGPSLRIVLSLCTLTMLTAVVPTLAQVTVFSSGYLTPENINLAPASFGAYAGQYFINDAAKNDPTQSRIYALPTTGGSPSGFASNLNGIAVGALFLPSSGWGTHSGHYLTVGESDIFGTAGQIFTYDAGGNRTPFSTSPHSAYAQAAIAPATFGANAGKLIVTDEFNGVFAFDSRANVTQITGANGLFPFGAAFAPTGFGKFSGSLFIDDGIGTALESIDAKGTLSLFAHTPLKSGQVGPRQLTFAPSGFFPGINRPLLMVSIGGSADERTLGDILVYDQNGAEIADLRPNLGLPKFSPRGLYFPGDGTVLVNDASDPILTLTPNAFVSTVPEPGAISLLLGSGVCGGLLWLRRKNKR